MGQYTSLPIFGKDNPKEGSRYVNLLFDFSVVGAAQVIFQTISLTDVGLSQIRGILVDNSLNPRGTFITVLDTQQTLRVRPGFQLRDEIYTGGLTITLMVSSTGAQPVTVKLFNVPLPYYHEYSFNPLAGSAQLPVFNLSGPVTLTTAALTLIAPANPKRTIFFVTVSLGIPGTLTTIGLGMAAQSGAAPITGFLTIPIGGGYPTVNWNGLFSNSDDNPIPTGAIYGYVVGGGGVTTATAYFNELTL